MMLVYPIVEQADQRKRACAESVLALLLQERPDLPHPRLGWFGEPANRDNRQMPKASYLLDRRRMDGCCYPHTAEIWIKSALNGQRLVEVVSHESFHYMQPLPLDHSEDDMEAHELTTKSFGLRAANLLCPRRGLFFSPEHLHHARPGDSTLMKHGDRQWVRTLGADGGWEWNSVPERYALFISNRPSVYR